MTPTQKSKEEAPRPAVGFPGDDDYSEGNPFPTNDGEWAVAFEDDGEKLSFGDKVGEVTSFIGTYRGDKDVTMPDTGEIVKLYRFADVNGKTFATWASYQLEQAMKDIAPGTPIKIDWLGKTGVGDSGQTMNRFRVMTKA